MLVATYFRISRTILQDVHFKAHIQDYHLNSGSS